MALTVIDPGPLATIQDEGRPDAADLGVPRAGACDPLAFAAANLLLGNRPDDPALELTLGGAELAVSVDCVVALAGADIGFRVQQDGRWLRPGISMLVHTGSTLVATGTPVHGCRTYLALAGGMDVPAILGSASTSPCGGFGGIGGRPLRAGDELRPTMPDRLAGAGHSWPGPGPSSGVSSDPRGTTVRVVHGPHRGEVGTAAVDALMVTTWVVAADSDRMGLRLDRHPPADVAPTRPTPSPVEGLVSGAGELESFPLTWGAVELPPDGSPIVLLVDAPTVGGYPVPLVVITADRPVLGQLRPGDTLRFRLVDLADAHAARAVADAELAEAAARLRTARAIW